MDISWLEKNSFLSRDKIRALIGDLTRRHFNSGHEWMGAAADLFSDLGPQSRQIFWEELEYYATDHINFKIDYVRNEIESKLAEYPPLPESAKEAAQEVFLELQRLWRRFDYNPKCCAEFGESLSVNGFFFEIRWILGQILSSFPDLIEVSDDEFEGGTLPSKYEALDRPYHIVEFFAKTLSDIHVQDFYTDVYPEALAAALEIVLRTDTRIR